MKILIGNILLAFMVLLNLVGFNAGVRYVAPDNEDPDSQPTYFMNIPEEQFHVETITLSAGSRENPDRLFNTNIVRRVPDTEYHKFLQFNILGTNLQFLFERDAYRRLINVIKLNGNRRPRRGTDNLYTYVATINGIEFLVHKNRHGTILGASPPPNQVPKPVMNNNKSRIEPEEPGPSHKRPRVVPSPACI